MTSDAEHVRENLFALLVVLALMLAVACMTLIATAVLQ
jgi:hypothetical protein